MSTKEKKIHLNVRYVDHTGQNSQDDSMLQGNLLVIGPSVSRKQGLVEDVLLNADDRYHSVVCTSHAQMWNEIKSDNGMEKLSIFDCEKQEFPEEELFASAEVKIFDEVPDLRRDEYLHFVADGSTIFMLRELEVPVPQKAVGSIRWVALFGGIKKLRRVYDMLRGALIPKFKDFRQIYLAATDEGDRYSDDFLLIKVDSKATDPNEIYFWGSLNRKNEKKVVEINIEQELILNRVHQAKEVELPIPQEQQAVEADTTVESTAANSQAEEEKKDNEGEAEAEADDCVIL